MARLIDASKLTYSAAVDDNDKQIFYVPAEEIDNAPTIDAEPVRHGRWDEKPFLLGTSYFCSVCGENYGMPHGKFNYCPNCGAKMDEVSK